MIRISYDRYDEIRNRLGVIERKSYVSEQEEIWTLVSNGQFIAEAMITSTTENFYYWPDRDQGSNE
ncbi:MAG: hypothetical protein ACRCWQ_02115 [Bacilli bacterium]